MAAQAFGGFASVRGQWILPQIDRGIVTTPLQDFSIKPRINPSA
jgi:hypothetical protein